MEPRFFETKNGVAIGWFLFALVFGTGFSVLMGDSLTDSILFGLAMGIGFAIGMLLFFKEDSPEEGTADGDAA